MKVTQTVGIQSLLRAPNKVKEKVTLPYEAEDLSSIRAINVWKMNKVEDL